MSTLGKLLIVFNLLAAGAFAYFTLENWKARQEVSWAAVERQVRLDGVALGKQTTPPSAEELGDDRVAFEIAMPNGTVYHSIPKKKFETLIPKGGEKFGGEPVAHQTAEVERLQKVVIASIPAGGNERFQWLYAYLSSLAHSGAERDGVNALFDLQVNDRKPAARRDLPLLGRTSSQTAALRTIVDVADLGDPGAIADEATRASRVGVAREAVKRLLLGEVSHGVAATGDRAEAERNLNNLNNAVQRALQERAGDAEKQALIAAAGGDPKGWEHLAAVAVEPLTDKPSADRAIAAMLAYAHHKAVTETEKNALTGIKDLIVALNAPALPMGFDLTKSIDSVAVNLLNSKFDDAARPLAAGKTGTGQSHAEKSGKIAHLLYHIDAWRHHERGNDAATDRKAWHERVATIIGLPEYIRAAEVQATEYAEAAQRLISVITDEQSAFEAEYQAQLQRVLFLYSQWLQLDNQLKAQDVLTNENERLQQERLTERNNLLTELADSTQKAKDALTALRQTQARLFSIQKDLRDAQAAILALEKELRRIELDDRKVGGQ